MKKITLIGLKNWLVNGEIKILVGLALGLIVYWCPGTSYSMTIADSQLDFAATQGENNWFYGYYTTPANTSSFTLMEFFSNNAWSESTSYPPYTILWESGGHPNDSSHGGEHWAVRRWVSEVNGNISISGHLADRDYGSNGNGIIGRIYVDGLEIYNHQISEGDLTGIDYLIDAYVEVGSFVDFVIDPNNTFYTDSTTFTSSISAIVPVPTSVLLLSIGIASLAGTISRMKKK